MLWCLLIQNLWHPCSSPWNCISFNGKFDCRLLVFAVSPICNTRIDSFCSFSWVQISSMHHSDKPLNDRKCQCLHKCGLWCNFSDFLSHFAFFLITFAYCILGDLLYIPVWRNLNGSMGLGRRQGGALAWISSTSRCFFWDCIKAYL
jgi:hypothetical protein